MHYSLRPLQNGTFLRILRRIYVQYEDGQEEVETSESILTLFRVYANLC